MSKKKPKTYNLEREDDLLVEEKLKILLKRVEKQVTSI